MKITVELNVAEQPDIVVVGNMKEMPGSRFELIKAKIHELQELGLSCHITSFYANYNKSEQ